MTTYLEADDPLSFEAYERVAGCYWVLVLPGESAEPWRWLFGLTEPPPVLNRSMHWRRPTYEEAVERQRMFDTEPAEFSRLAEHGGLSRRRR